jgi:hypothetical protein
MKLIFSFAIIGLLIYGAIHYDVPKFLYKEANSITEADDSFDKSINERHVLSKQLLLDTTKVSKATYNELQRLLNYHKTAEEDIKKLTK